MRRLIKIIAIVALAALIYSILPVIPLYLQKKAPMPTNDQIAEKLKANKDEPFSFIAFGDNHAGFIFDDSAFLKIISRINREGRFRKFKIDFVMGLGDIAFRKGTRWEYTIYNRLRSRVKFPVISAMGNHDDDRHGEHLFKEQIGKKNFRLRTVILTS
jgi:Calcineurin-like phosphoesterase.